MDKHERIAQIRCLLVTMNIDRKLPETIDKFPVDWLKEALDNLKSIHKNQFVMLNKAKALLPEETWERYRKWGGFEDHRESQLLMEAQKQFDKALNENRPRLFRKGVVNAYLKKDKKKKLNRGASQPA